MNTRTFRRLSAAIGGAALLGAALVAPTAAVATPLPAEDAQAGVCQVDQAALGWGMKESFRTYITGSIANGSWETGEGVEYIEPALDSSGAIEPGTNLFEWSAASGEISSALEGGTVSFTGNVHFTGHDGALSLNIGDPAIEFTDAETAHLLLAIGEAEAGAEVPQVRAAKIELGGVLEAEGQSLTISGAPVILTAEGAEAFNGGRGSYVSGDEMDPLFFEATVSGCEFGAVVVAPPAEDTAAEGTETTVPEEEVVAISDDQQDFPWLPIVIGGIALVVVAVAATMLVMGRPKKQSTGGDPAAD